MLPLHHTSFSVFNYDEIPAGYYYRAMTEGRAAQRFWHRKKFLEVAEKISDGAHVLDFGCGPGSFLSVLGETRPGCRATGVDLASVQIEFARREVEPSFPAGRIAFQQLAPGEERLPFADASYDIATAIEVIEHIHPFFAIRALLELRRVLRPEGRLLLTTPNYRSLWPLVELGLERLSPVKYHDQHISKFTPNALVKLLETAGFEVLSLRSIFVAAPFLAGISWGLAEGAHAVEKLLPARPGCLLVAEARPVAFGGRKS